MRFGHEPARILSVIALTFFLATPAIHAQEGNAELLHKLEYLQQQIDELKKQLEQTQNQAVETDAKVEAVAEVIEAEPLQAVSVQRTTIGGYGELHYNNLSAEDPSRDVEMIDFHRFVLFLFLLRLLALSLLLLYQLVFLIEFLLLLYRRMVLMMLQISD